MKKHQSGSAKLNRPLYLTLLTSSLALWLTGAAWLCLHYFGRTEGEFGIVTHPLESVMLQFHGFVFIPALLSLGAILFGHIGSAWNYRKNKSTGLIMVAIFALLIGSGYILYYTGSDALRQASSFAHWITGLVAPVIFIQHALIRARRSAGRRNATSNEAAIASNPRFQPQSR